MNERDRELERMTRELDAKRIAAGVCRHCAGPVPCWSRCGDSAVGVYHTEATYRDALKLYPRAKA